MFRRILVPIAFSARCQGAAQYAEALAQHFHSELTLLHVVAPVPVYSFPEAVPAPSAGIDDLLPPARAQLEKFAGGALQGVPVKAAVAAGDPAQQIVAYANAGKFDLIVMPTHGYGPFRRFLLGSVTAKVVHDAGCPVWTGPHLENATAYSSIAFRKILCAVDLSPDSLAVLQWAGSFAQPYGASLEVIHAIPQAASSAGSSMEPDSRLAEEARGRISFFLEDLGLTGEITVKAGSAPDVVRAVAQQNSADLLVIGRGHASGVLGRLRTNAYAILRESPCPVAAI
jgi:nucleotide-binding universal stress UspA family protein